MAPIPSLHFYADLRAMDASTRTAFRAITELLHEAGQTRQNMEDALGIWQSAVKKSHASLETLQAAFTQVEPELDLRWTHSKVPSIRHARADELACAAEAWRLRGTRALLTGCTVHLRYCFRGRAFGLFVGLEAPVPRVAP